MCSIHGAAENETNEKSVRNSECTQLKGFLPNRAQTAKPKRSNPRLIISDWSVGLQGQTDREERVLEIPS